MKRISITDKLSYFDLEDGGGLLFYEAGKKNLGPIVLPIETREDLAKGIELIRAIEN